MSKELIDRKQIPYLLAGHEDNTKPEGVTLRSIIDKMATVDAVEVVRCKDCIQWDDKEKDCCVFYNRREFDYCSYGERRSDNDKSTL